MRFICYGNDLKFGSEVNMSSKILPFEKSPMFKTFQYLAYLFGILEASPHTLPWICCNFIFCFPFNFDEADIWMSHEKILIREIICEDPKKLNYSSFIDLIN